MQLVLTNGVGQKPCVRPLRAGLQVWRGPGLRGQHPPISSGLRGRRLRPTAKPQGELRSRRRGPSGLEPWGTVLVGSEQSIEDQHPGRCAQTGRHILTSDAAERNSSGAQAGRPLPSSPRARRPGEAPPPSPPPSWAAWLHYPVLAILLRGSRGCPSCRRGGPLFAQLPPTRHTAPGSRSYKLGVTSVPLCQCPALGLCYPGSGHVSRGACDFLTLADGARLLSRAPWRHDLRPYQRGPGVPVSPHAHQHGASPLLKW